MRAEIVPLLADEGELDRMRRAAGTVGTREGAANVVALLDAAQQR